MGRYASWGLREGDEIAPGRHAVRLLGGGDRYEAYLAFDDDMHHLVVAKVLRPDRAGEARALAGLALEARMLDRVRHPSIVRGFGSDLRAERPHILLEFLEGPRLSTLVRRYGLAVEQATSLGLQLASAMHAMSRRGYVHLDLKPRNIIMTGPPRVIDLSVAHAIEDARAITEPIGTPRYMAPEQCDPAGRGPVGPPADVWGIGVTLYEAIAGRPAFPREPGGEPHPQLRAPVPAFPRRLRVPGTVARIIAEATAHDPAERPAAVDVARALEDVVDDLPRPRLGLFKPGT